MLFVIPKGVDMQMQEYTLESSDPRTMLELRTYYRTQCRLLN